MSILVARIVAARPWLLLLLTVAVASSSLRGIWTNFQMFGLFRTIGVDFALYLAQSAAFVSADRSAMYYVEVIAKYLQPLLAFTTDPSMPFDLGTVPYPPLFAWLISPLTLVQPNVAFALWTVLNLTAAVYLGARAARLFGARERPWVLLLVITSLPMVATLTSGQPMVLVACTLGECYLSLRAGRDLRAGVWLAALVLKPQYLVAIGPVLVWKRRWRALSGLVAAAVVVFGGSLLVAGIRPLLAYPQAILGESAFRGGYLVHPELMVNWRELVLYFLPDISDTSGLVLTLALSVVTLLALAPAWRGPWLPQSARFPVQFMALLLGTLLVSYHGHLSGLLLFTVPVASLLAEGELGRAGRIAILVLCFQAVVQLVASVRQPFGLLVIWPGTTLVLAVCLAFVIAEAWSARNDQTSHIERYKPSRPRVNFDVSHSADTAMRARNVVRS